MATTALRVKIFADGADKSAMLKHYANPMIAGFTTNPTLMRKAGINDYRAFAVDILSVITDRSISFEVFSDEPEEMDRQAKILAALGPNVRVKIPVTNAKGQSSAGVIEKLSGQGIKVNVTAMTTFEQVELVAPLLSAGAGGYVSVMAGRIADSGRDPLPVMKRCVDLLDSCPGVELLWASPREVLNVVQADNIGCHIITVTDDILKKLPAIGSDLNALSLDLVQMFHKDAAEAGFNI